MARNLRAFPRAQMRDVRSLPPAEVAIASVLAAGLWALQTRSWRRTELHVKNRDDRPGSNRQTEHRGLWALQSRSWPRAEVHVKNRDERPGSNRQTEHRGLWALQTRSWRRTELHVKNRDNRPGSNRQTEHRVLAGPLGRSIAQASDADAARQSPFDGSLHEVRREERERDGHIDLSNAAFVAGGNLLDTGHGASNNLIKPTSAARDRCETSVARVSARIGRRS